MEAFYNNLFPTITAARARFMLTSTQNGYNLFYRLYMSAVAGDNEYKPFKTDWDEVPEWNPDKMCWEKRDEAWHRLQVANYGSEEAFNAQFGTSFDVSAKTLVNRKKLRKKKSDLIEFVEKDLYGVPHSDCYVWHPNYEPMDQLKRDYIVITVDLAEGAGGDYTVATLYRMANRDSDNLECVGYFRSNKTLREQFSLSLQTLICKYLNLDRTLLSYEKNTYGELFYRDLMDNMEKDKLISHQFDPSILVKYYNDSGTKFVHGIKMTSGNKSSHCILFKESYERDKIINNDTKFYNELLTFIDDGTGHFKASVGHDDLMMASIQLEFVKSTLQYKIMRGEFGSGIEITEQDENIYNPFENTWWLDQMEQDMNSTRSRLSSF
jgi:hypothetical protein